ncbi:MAG: reverse transcriptase domain-containing protein, partial [Patescibacteria group bacterium]
YNYIISIENLLEAWREFKRGKMSKPDVQAFAYRLEDEIFGLHNELAAKIYVHGSYEHFIVRDPKHRHIHKASVRDRLLHHAIVRVIEPIFDRKFIHGSWSCRKGKGTHAAVDWFCARAWAMSKNGTRTVWVLKLDVAKYFASVDQAILTGLVQRHIRDLDALCLIEKVIQSFESGIPLGNVTSQLFANVYLNELDQFVTGALRFKEYLRYCDDLFFLDCDFERLERVRKIIESFLTMRLKLQIKQSKVVFRRFHQGVDVLGQICFPHFRLLRTKTKRRMLRRISENNRTSYMGLVRPTRAFRLERILDAQMNTGSSTCH